MKQPFKDKAVSTLYIIRDKIHNSLPKVKSFVGKNIILLLAIIAAIISCCFVPPNENYSTYINYKTICTLLSLLLVTRAMRSIKMFRTIAFKILQKVHTTRQLAIILIWLPTLFSLFLTNDIAVLTFVPFSMVLLKIANQNELSPKIIPLQILGANLSGMVSPLGSAQNLLIYEHMGVGANWFITNLYPIAIAGYLLLIIMTVTVKNKQIEPIVETKRKIPWVKYVIYSLLFLICILAVLKVIDIYYTTLAVVICVLLLDPKVFKKTNYSIIIMFTSFFILVGNLSSIPEIKNAIETAVSGNEYYITVGLSQVIFNTAATLLVYRFAANYVALAAGVTVGKFGTFFASMSYFMAYSMYQSSTHDKILVKKFFRNLILYNLLFFVVTFSTGLLVVLL